MSQRTVIKGLAYLCALSIGLAFVAWLIPLDQVFPAHALDVAFAGDSAQSVIGQRYFLGEPWHWPLLRVERLDWPGGLSVIFTDSIPLAILPLKLARSLLPPGFFVQEGWLALAWTLQPVAAVFALRSAGERRLLPAIAVAVISLCMPSLLQRLGQTSLCTHALLLCAIGLYFRLNRSVGWRHGCAAIVLLCAALLVHPYLLVMATGVLAAAPLNLGLQRDWRWLACAGWLAAALGVTACVGVLLGYGGSGVAPGYGIYSMNLLGPVVPGGQGAVPFSIPDPTGGQVLEGYQYLGAGVLLLAAAAIVAAVRDGRWPGLRAHPGLLLAMLGLTLFAVSGVAYLGGWRISQMRRWPNFVLQFRATGRFFWPVSYLILIGSVAAIARAWPRFGIAVLAAAVGLQIGDTRHMLANARSGASGFATWQIDVPALTPILAKHDLLTVWPAEGCGAETVHSNVFLQLLLLGSRTLIRTSTMYSARPDTQWGCDPQTTLGQPWQPGELRVILPPGRAAERRFVPDADRLCRSLPPMILCAQDPPAGPPLADDATPTLSLGERLDHDAPLLKAALGEGWDQDEYNGIWTLGGDAVLRFRLPDGTSPVRLTMNAFAMPPARGSKQGVQVLANGRPVAEWAVSAYPPTTMQAVLPAGTTELRFHIQLPTRSTDRNDLDNARRLGLHMMSLRLDPA